MHTFTDDWMNGFEIKYEELRGEQQFYCRGDCPRCGDLIYTHGPTFEIVSVQKESSSLFSGVCVQK